MLGRMRSVRIAVVALAVAIGASAVAVGDTTTTEADIVANVSMSVSTPATAIPSGIRQVVPYTLTLVNRGDHDERVRIQIDPPDWDGAGSAMGIVGEPIVVSGPATILLGSAVTITTGCAHGAEPQRRAPSLLLPAGSTSQLLTNFTSLSSGLWRGLDMRTTFKLRRDAGLTAHVLEIARGPQLPITGLPSAHVTLTTQPHTARVELRDPIPHLRRGTTFRVSGAVDPPTAGRTVKLKVIGPHDRSLKPLVTLHTDAKGRFSARWRPATKGQWSVWALASADAAASADFACPQAVILR
jgi:hypothetical protein